MFSLLDLGYQIIKGNELSLKWLEQRFRELKISGFVYCEIFLLKSVNIISINYVIICASRLISSNELVHELQTALLVTG